VFPLKFVISNSTLNNGKNDFLVLIVFLDFFEQFDCLDISRLVSLEYQGDFISFAVIIFHANESTDIRLGAILIFRVGEDEVVLFDDWLVDVIVSRALQEINHAYLIMHTETTNKHIDTHTHIHTVHTVHTHKLGERSE